MKYLLISLAIISIFITCSFPVVQEVSFISDTYEPTDHVEILSSWPRNRKFIEISKLEVSTGDRAEEELIDKAKEIGADAIVIGASHRRGYLEVPIDAGKTHRKVLLDRIQAIAIKYNP